ncbi:hypothetical protein [Nesterenkonia sp. CF4.4]|uniref:hypothetical protein n=1 Tax=Nesterenkonia sp. CF4.4 TaxID=3373079 RepID=UPI003EE6BEC1
MLLVVSLALKLRGALVVRPPRSINPSSNLCLWIHRLGCRLSDVVLWRTEPSQRYAKVGQLAPDTAFGEPRTLGLAWSERKRLVVSMRGKRRFPSVQWFESIRDIASKADLDLIVVTQVREDEQRSAEIATELGAELHVWDQVEDIDQEVRLRELYETAAIVVSDRLHVLVLGAMAGAVPLELSDRPVSKILDTFAQVGMTDVVFDTASSQSSDAVRFAFRAVDGREKMSQKLDDANTRLKEALSSVHA